MPVDPRKLDPYELYGVGAPPKPEEEAAPAPAPAQAPTPARPAPTGPRPQGPQPSQAGQFTDADILGRLGVELSPEQAATMGGPSSGRQIGLSPESIIRAGGDPRESEYYQDWMQQKLTESGDEIAGAMYGVQVPKREQPTPMYLVADFAGLTGDLVQINERWRPVMNFLGGFNARLATLIGAPAQAVTEAMKLSHSGLAEGLDPITSIQSAFEAVGINAEATDTLASNMGRDVFDSLMIVGGIFAAAPTLAAKEGMSVGAILSREIAEFAQKYPGLTIATEIGAGLGVSPGEWVGESIGGVAGGVAGGIAAGAAFTTGVGLSRRLNKFARQFLHESFQTLNEPNVWKRRPFTKSEQFRPLLFEDLNADAARFMAEFAVQKDLDDINAVLRKTVNDLPVDLPATQQEVILRSSLNDAERVANMRVSQAWEDVGLDRYPAQAEKVIEAVAEVQARSRDDAQQYPVALVKQIRESLLARGYTMEEIGFMWDMPGKPMNQKELAKIFDAVQEPEQGTMRMVHQWRSRAMQERYNAVSGDVSDTKLGANYSIISKAAMEDLETAASAAGAATDVNLKMARRISTEYNDLFERGPLSALFDLTANRDAKVDVEKTLEYILSKTGGVRHLKYMDERVDQAHKYMRRRGMDLNERNSIMDELQESIWAQFQKQAETVDEDSKSLSRRAERWLNAHTDELKDAASVQAETNGAWRVLSELLDHKAAVSNSAIAKFLKSDIGSGVRRFFDSPTGAEDLKRFFRHMQSEDAVEAMAGFRHGMIAELFRRTGMNAVRMRRDLDDPKIRQMFEVAFGKDQMATLNKIVDLGLAIETGKTSIWRRAPRALAIITARIFGAQSGKVITRYTGGGTVQVPGITSGAFKNIAERIFKEAPPHLLMAWAVQDPRMMALLERRLPRSVPEMKSQLKAVRRVIAYVETLEDQRVNKLIEDARHGRTGLSGQELGAFGRSRYQGIRRAIDNVQEVLP